MATGAFVLAADLTEMQVIASLDESDVGRIRPKQSVRFRVDAYPNAERRLWVQEEPENMGAWRYLALKAEQELGVRLEPVCREEGAAPAAGSPTLHQQEQQELLDRAFAGL